MAYLFRIIIEELKNHEIQKIRFADDYLTNNLILRLDKFHNRAKIYSSVSKYYSFPLIHFDYYKISLELSFSKIINIIWCIMLNDYTNSSNTNSSNAILTQNNNYIILSYLHNELLIGLTNDEKLESKKHILTIKFNPNIKNIESIVENEIIKSNYFIILYKLNN